MSLAILLYMVAGAMMGGLASMALVGRLVRMASPQRELTLLHACRANAWSDVGRDLLELADDEEARGELRVASVLRIMAARATSLAEGQMAIAEASTEGSRRERPGPPRD